MENKIRDNEVISSKSENNEIISNETADNEMVSNETGNQTLDHERIDHETAENEKMDSENQKQKEHDSVQEESQGRNVFSIDGLPSSERENFTRLCNKLLGVGFICKKKSGSRKDYYFIQKHRKLFEEYLSVLGYVLEIHEEYGVVHLRNRLNYNHYRLKLYDTMILIILRILYDEKKRELSLMDDVIVTIGEIQEKYQALKIRNGLIDKTTMNHALMLFKRFQLLDTLDKDLTLEDARVLLLDSILLAVKVEDIKEAFDKLQIYRKGMQEELDGQET